MRVKKTAKKLAYGKRHLAISSHEVVKAKRLKLLIQTLFVLVEETKKKEEERSHPPQIVGTENELGHLDKILKISIVRYLHLVIERPIHHDDNCRPNAHRTIESFRPSECLIYFRFTRAHLFLLVELLLFPQVVKFDNRAKMSGEEVLLRGLHELPHGSNKFIIANEIFGGPFTLQSRALTWFINHIYDSFHHLLHDNLNWWQRCGFFTKSAEAIGRKMGIVNNMIAHFIDCNCLPTSHVGGGPAEEGANAARWDDDIQRSFYNGWKSIHGLKHQTVDNAFGFTVDMHGPASLRRNDLALLRTSNINERMAFVQMENLVQYFMFGDSAYHWQTHLRSYREVNNPVEGLDDFRMWNIRILSFNF
jgi:hypothetical protein